MGAKDRHIDMTAPDHGEGRRRIEERHPAHPLEVLAPGIDQVDILLALFPRFNDGPAVEDAAFAVVKDRPVLGHKAGDHCRDTDAQVNVGAVGQLFGNPHGDNLPGQTLFIG